MNQRTPLRSMDGLLVVDKAAGMSSHDVVQAVRRATGERSVGHLGTLDPMATGALPLLLGKYTRLAQFFGSAEKEYTGTIRFGWSTDTFDAEGTASTEYVPLRATLEELRVWSRHFHGELDQMPPAFSAKKVGGVPAYRLARAGKEVALKPARIYIHAFELDELYGEVASFRMRVSAGGYVRSVAQELGQMAGCGAHLASLRRVAAGPFTLPQTVRVEELATMTPEMIERRCIAPRSLLPEMPAVIVDEVTAGRLRNGMQVNVPEFSRTALVKIFAGPRDLIAVARRVAGTLVQPVVVMR